mmetsp:Transcript_48651/g.91155  ORF Transcript_48651/g.91155 Transcript_48651/m.91155 type:complete len:228 (+) Transcript_48651:75-758(+)
MELAYENTFFSVKELCPTMTRAKSVPPKRGSMSVASDAVSDDNKRDQYTMRVARLMGMDIPEPQAERHVNFGSSYHPELCARPCAQFAIGRCKKELTCRYCHCAHAHELVPMIKLDKKQRELLRTLGQGEIMEFLAEHLRERAQITGPVQVVEVMAMRADEIAAQNMDAARLRISPARRRNLSKSFSQLSCIKMIHWALSNRNLSAAARAIMLEQLHKLRREAIFHE